MIERRRPAPCSPRHRSCSPAHAAMVADYRAAREAHWSQMECVTALYDTEVSEYLQHTPAPTFGDWLRNR